MKTSGRRRPGRTNGGSTENLSIGANPPPWLRTSQPAAIRADRHRIDLPVVTAQNHGVSRRIFGTKAFSTKPSFL